jgi:putative peptidoglycan lipid II flippase
MIRGIVTVGVWTTASRLLGFVRDILIAALLGAGPVADAFFVANRLPNLFRRLFGEGAFNAAFVPAFAGMLAAEGPAAAKAFAEEAISVMAFWLFGITIAAEIFMPGLMRLVAPGFAEIPGKFAIAVELGRITFPYMPLICLVALFSGILNGLDRFAAAAASQMVYNVVSIAFMVTLAGVLATPGHALAWGVSASGVFQLALVAWAVRRAGMRLAIPRPRLTPQMRQLLKKMAPGLVGAGVVQINSLVDVVIGSLLPPGTVAVLYYADRVNQLPLGIIGTAVGTALLPTLSREVRGGQPAQAIATLNRAIEYALLLTLPAAFALAVAARPIVTALFEHGKFGADDGLLTTQALAAYASGLPAFVLMKVLVPAFFARGDTSLPVKTGIAAVVVNLALNVAFMSRLQHLGPPLASSIASWGNVLALAIVLRRRRQMILDAKLRRCVPRMLAACLAMTAVLLGIERFLLPAMDSLPVHGMRVVGLAVLVSGGIAAYALSAQALGAFDVMEVAGGLLRRRRRKATAAG